MRSKWNVCAGLMALAALVAPASRAQNAAADWPMYRHDLGGTGYSQLKQINTENVTKLAQSWSLQLADRGGLEVTPIVVNDVMYLSGSNKVLALDADTGKEIWHYDVTGAPTRGVAAGKHVIQPLTGRKIEKVDADQPMQREQLGIA